MTRRPAITLIEVLVTLFIMAIGMLALLVLFPLGAISMGRALKDDRCASTASMAENVAIALDVRHDPNVLAAFTTSSMVYVDFYGVALGPLGGVIPRVAPSFAPAVGFADRWFTLPDDLTLSASGMADTSQTGGILDRGRRYSYAYLLTQLQPNTNETVQLHVVVYSGRAVAALQLEQLYAATGTADSNTIVATWTVQPPPNVRRGGWILDAAGNFYRVTNLDDVGGGTMVLEVTPNLVTAIGAAAGNPTNPGIIVLDDVAEVFDKGTSWKP